MVWCSVVWQEGCSPLAAERMPALQGLRSVGAACAYCKCALRMQLRTMSAKQVSKLTWSEVGACSTRYH